MGAINSRMLRNLTGVSFRHPYPNGSLNRTAAPNRLLFRPNTVRYSEVVRGVV